jgi:RNA polymerase sigma-70 factor (ECF subfamily)
LSEPLPATAQTRSNEDVLLSPAGRQETDFTFLAASDSVGRLPAFHALMNSEAVRHNFTEAGTAPDTEVNGVAKANGTGEPLDDTLVSAARQGDLRAFGDLVKRHWNTCLKRATMMLRNRSDAEDEVQNAFWKALQRLDQFRGEGSFSAWLNRIVENQCLMRIREEQNARFIYLDEATESAVRLELVSQRAGPEDALGLEEVLVLLRREISRMPPLLRNVMLLRDLDQLPMPDVANRLGLSVPAAKSRLIRARTELRSRVTKHCGRKGVGTLMQMAKYEQSAYTRAH